MNYVFYSNKCKKIKNVSLQKDALFYLVDISTERKGPVYTIVNNLHEQDKEQFYRAEIDISYSNQDVPFIEDTKLSSFIKINSFNNYYSLCPLVHQMIKFNNFIDVEGMTLDNYIWIEFIRLFKNNGDKIYIDTSLVDDKDINKSFEHLKMNTSVHKYLCTDTFLIIFKNDEWKIVTENQLNKLIEKDFNIIDKIVFNVSGTETCYLLSLKEYLLFSQKIKICLTFKTNMSADDESEVYYDEIYMNDINDILNACLFAPQLLLLEQQIYDECIDFSLDVKYPNRNTMTLNVSHNEIMSTKNTCIFDILKRLLEIKL